MKKKYVFIKKFITNEGYIPEGTEIVFFRDGIYMNGGLLQPSYYNIIQNIIDNDALRKEYLKECNIIYNKI